MRNNLRQYRHRFSWSQHQLAQHSGLSRAEISAIETERVIPSTAAALFLARAFDCSVEELFGLGEVGTQPVQWAWKPYRSSGQFWQARVEGKTLLFPTEWTLAGHLRHDGVYNKTDIKLTRPTDQGKTLVIAGCDPSVGLLAAQIQTHCGFRVLPLTRSSREAIRLLGRGLVHAAGLHFDHAENLRTAQKSLKSGFRFIRIAQWEEGIALDPSLKSGSVRDVLASNLRWVSREEGSGARQCLDQILGSGRKPNGYHNVARDHYGVSETIRTGWAQAGVCVRLTAQERGLRFLRVREESYTLCYLATSESSPLIQNLVQMVRSRSYRDDLGDLPGYNSANSGEFI